MLIVKNDTQEGFWTSFEVWGTEIEVKIRPRTENLVQTLATRHKALYDEAKTDAMFNDLIDHIIEDFRGIADANPAGGDPVPWQVTLENKKRLINLRVPVGEKPIFDRIFDRANRLGFDVDGAERKN